MATAVVVLAIIGLAAAGMWWRQPVWRLELVSPQEGLYKLTNVGRRHATNVRLDFKDPAPKLTRSVGPWEIIEPTESVFFVALPAHGLEHSRIGIRATETSVFTRYRTQPHSAQSWR